MKLGEITKLASKSYKRKTVPQMGIKMYYLVIIILFLQSLYNVSLALYVFYLHSVIDDRVRRMNEKIGVIAGSLTPVEIPFSMSVYSYY